VKRYFKSKYASIDWLVELDTETGRCVKTNHSNGDPMDQPLALPHTTEGIEKMVEDGAWVEVFPDGPPGDHVMHDYGDAW